MGSEPEENLKNDLANDPGENPEENPGNNPQDENESKYGILVVDDERSNLAVLNRILSSEYTVFTAKSGEEALSRVERDRPDLILLDIVMPGMDGFEVLRKLKASQETRNIPVIFITELSGEESEERGLFLGAVDYIMKPFKNAIVLARVRAHIQIVHQLRTIERLGLMDPLTDIPNRRSFDNHIGIEWRRCIRERRSISFMMMDLDTFKSYNDTYGHPQGDVLLKTVAKIFAAAARRPSDLPARLGGEEFGLLLPNTDLAGAVAAAEKIRVEVENRKLLTAAGVVTSATISIGVTSIVPTKGDAVSVFVAKADENLYKAKKAGRNRIVSD
ncbi:MAG: diguanylate cyclase [Synergistaceae bacterium]|jgi:diguanylate cyclase (GGDEF)-like protein|nr:diguanylate cyclase [Synergistaceae bacterium]